MSIKRHILAKQSKNNPSKQKETNFGIKDTTRLKLNGKENISYDNSNKNRVEMFTITSDKIDFRTKCFTMEK